MIRYALALVLATPAAAVDCRYESFEAVDYVICEVAADEDLRLFHSDENGTLLGGFRALEEHVSPAGLAFAMNAGMFRADYQPAGLYVEQGEEVQPLVTRDGPGNFGLLPNGVFCISETLDVVETITFAETLPACTYATQSGPMLVIDGKLHPRFIPDSDSLYIRNGVGTTADGSRAIFAISDAPVNFDTFGRLFRDHLKTPNALYLDGAVSRLHAPDINRSDIGFTYLGPLLGVVN